MGITMKKIILLMSVAGLMAGCSSPAQRMADCQAQGISKDTCHLAEQNRQTAVLGAAEKQAMENASKAVK